MTEPEARVTYLVLDGEDLDATLGSNVLGRRPAHDARAFNQPLPRVRILDIESVDPQAFL